MARRREVLREVKERLFGVVEVAGDDELFGERNAEALFQVVKTGFAFGVGDGEGGRGEDDGGVVGEEGFGEELRDVDGCGLEVGRQELKTGVTVRALRAALRRLEAARRSIQKTVLGSVDSRRNLR